MGYNVWGICKNVENSSYCVKTCSTMLLMISLVLHIVGVKSRGVCSLASFFPENALNFSWQKLFVAFVRSVRDLAVYTSSRSLYIRKTACSPLFLAMSM